MPKHRLAKRLKQLRAARRLSQSALADKAGISRGYLARLETAQQDPTLTVLEKLAKALKVSLAELVK
jgi:transcriptional regulator with XRE-family HTH domain